MEIAGAAFLAPQAPSLSWPHPASGWRGLATSGFPPLQASLLALLSSLPGAKWCASGQPPGPGCRPRPSHPAPHHAEKILGTISAVLKEPPGFAHLTENKRPKGRLGFHSEVCFFSANSLVGREGHSATLFVQTSFLKGTHPTSTPACDLLWEMVFHSQVNSLVASLQVQKIGWLKVSSWGGGGDTLC